MNEVVFDRSSLIVYLIKNPNTKARKIASFFGRKPREVNRLLYGNLKLFESNDAYEWSLKQEFQPRNRSSKNPDSQAIQIVAGTCQSEEDTKFHWDPHQKIVIELHGNEYSLIDAGPGCGKTAVACARVAHLIENLDLEPSKILLISFTRTAIKELKERIQLYVEDSTSVAGVQMCTLDSFTWQALFGTSSENREKLFYSFDDNIGEFIQKLKNRDSVILDYLEEFEHVCTGQLKPDTFFSSFS